MKTNANERVKIARTKIALSQTEFAVALNSSVSLLTKIESGVTEPSSKFLKKISEKYGVDYDWLQEGVGEFGFDRKMINKVDNYYKDIAFEAIKHERDTLKQYCDKLLHILANVGGKQLALKYTGKIRQAA